MLGRGILVGAVAIVAACAAMQKQWPDTDPPRGLGFSMEIKGVWYKKIEVRPSTWQWAVDKDLMRAQTRQEAHDRELYSALGSRILSDPETAEVTRQGLFLSVPLHRTVTLSELQDDYAARTRRQTKLRQLGD